MTAAAPPPKLARYTQLSTVFTPGAPVSNRDLFAGRLDQVFKISAALSEPGRHVVLYGERGVGKTSFANLLSQLVYPVGSTALIAARVNCTTQDSFTSIWSKALRAMNRPVPDDWRGGTPDPDDIRYLLAEIEQPVAVVLDEYDRVEDDEALSLMADTIKALSDHMVRTKLVIIGVATSIDNLIGEHESVQRAIEQVLMPRMSQSELEQVIDLGLQAVEMTITDHAKRRVVRLAEGMPHYVHLLMLRASQRTVMDDRDKVVLSDVQTAVSQAIAGHSLLKEYQTAIQSSRPENLFSRVLVACALAEKNALSQFTASAVREPMSRIMEAPYGIPAFAPHLKAFTQADRGAVLIEEGPDRRHTYRFRNPLLQPFALLSALSDGLLPEEYSKELFDR